MTIRSRFWDVDLPWYIRRQENWSSSLLLKHGRSINARIELPSRRIERSVIRNRHLFASGERLPTEETKWRTAEGKHRGALKNATYCSVQLTRVLTRKCPPSETFVRGEEKKQETTTKREKERERARGRRLTDDFPQCCLAKTRSFKLFFVDGTWLTRVKLERLAYRWRVSSVCSRDGAPRTRYRYRSIRSSGNHLHSGLPEVSLFGISSRAATIDSRSEKNQPSRLNHNARTDSTIKAWNFTLKWRKWRNFMIQWTMGTFIWIFCFYIFRNTLF